MLNNLALWFVLSSLMSGWTVLRFSWLFFLPHHLSYFWVACFEISRLFEVEEDRDEKEGVKVRFCK